MQEELEDLKPELLKSALENDAMLKQIEQESKEVEEKGDKVKAEEAVANAQVCGILKINKNYCQENWCNGVKL